MNLRINFGYEQAWYDDVERCRGLYVYDADTGLVVLSEDVEPTVEVMEAIKKMRYVE